MKCSNELDFEIRKMLAEAFYNALVTQVFIFVKAIWINDMGFIFEEKILEVPKRYDGDKEKLTFFKKGLAFIDEGFKCDYFTDNREAIELNIVKMEKRM